MMAVGEHDVSKEDSKPPGKAQKDIWRTGAYTMLLPPCKSYYRNFQRTENDGIGLVDELLASFLVLPQLRRRGYDFDVLALSETIPNLQTGRTRLPIDEDLFGGEQFRHAGPGRCRRGGKRRDARCNSGHGREEGER